MIEIRMPNLGEGVTEGTIVRWLKAEGDAVGEGEILAEIMTDKVNVEFESPAAGIVRKLHFPEEAIVKVGTVIALVELPTFATSRPYARGPGYGGLRAIYREWH